MNIFRQETGVLDLLQKLPEPAGDASWAMLPSKINSTLDTFHPHEFQLRFGATDGNVRKFWRRLGARETSRRMLGEHPVCRALRYASWLTVFLWRCMKTLFQ